MKTAKLFLSPLRRAKSRRDGALLTVCFSLRTFSLRAILLPALLFFTCANLHAQVTIGGLEEPHRGSVLDLNSTVKGGLLLSNVVLDNLYTIPATFPGMSSPPVDANEKFTGALVYHEGGNGIPAGIYVWNGENWSPATENCTAPALTLNVPPVIKTGENVLFSVASDASFRCAEGETYAWSVSGDNGSTYSSLGSGASVIASFAAEGGYRIKAALTSPYSSTPVVKEVDVTVTADGAPSPSMLTYTYGIVGETCLDVKKTAQGKTSDVFNARTDAFKDGFTKEYKFVHSDDYSALSLSFYDPGHLVAGITPPSPAASGSGEQEIKVTFRSNIKDLVPASGDSLTVKLYASYKNSSQEIKYAYLDIRVEDGTCICPAKTGSNTWLNFMCHNLGGLDIISPSQLITYEHHGDWYRFGAKNYSLKNEGTNNGTVTNWTATSHPDYPFYTGNGDWPSVENGAFGNPCPAGWQLPTYEEWAAVINSSNNTATNVPAWWGEYQADQSVFRNLKKFGDYLYLPTAGSRYDNGGWLSNRGYSGQYWSSKSSGSNGNDMEFSRDNETVKIHVSIRTFGLSVRCVQAE